MCEFVYYSFVATCVDINIESWWLEKKQSVLYCSYEILLTDENVNRMWIVWWNSFQFKKLLAWTTTSMSIFGEKEKEKRHCFVPSSSIKNEVMKRLIEA